jgi:hypothetical protein
VDPQGEDLQQDRRAAVDLEEDHRDRRVAVDQDTSWDSQVQADQEEASSVGTHHSFSMAIDPEQISS